MKVVYWNTSCLEPEIEAVSKEIFSLADNFPGSWICAVNRHLRFTVSLRRRVIGFHPRLQLLARLFVKASERRFDISHLYGQPSGWPFSCEVGRRPIVLTIATESGEPNVVFWEKCEKIIVQTPGYRQAVLDHGIDPDKVELMFAPVDLTRFSQQKPRQLSGVPVVLFATSPRESKELHGRGVPLLLDAATELPHSLFRLLFRKWRSENTAYEEMRQVLLKEPRANVELELRNVTDMSCEYKNADFTVIPFTHRDAGKPCPNSMVEGMACGLPVLISERSPMAEFVRENACGAVFGLSGDSIRKSFEWACRNYEELSTNAANVARTRFGAQEQYREMRAIYEEVNSGS